MRTRKYVHFILLLPGFLHDLLFNPVNVRNNVPRLIVWGCMIEACNALCFQIQLRMTREEEFIKKIEAILNLRIGAILASSTLKNNLSKLNKSRDSLTAEDCRTLIDDIVKATAIFVTPGESKLVQSDLTKLLKEYFKMS